MFVCGDDCVSCYPGADDVASEPGCTQWQRVRAVAWEFYKAVI